MGRSFASALRRPSLFSERIISLTITIRLDSKNMCSVRQRPIPSAPNFLAVVASDKVSAFARTFMWRSWSAHFIKVAKASVNSGSMVETSPIKTSPFVPSIVIKSPSETTSPAAVKLPSFSLICKSKAPVIQGLPMPLATTAA